MEYRFESRFYFSDDNSPISVEYKTIPLEVPFEVELLAFCLHLIRVLLNTSHSFYGKNLSHILTRKDSFVEYFIASSRFKIQPYLENPTKKKIITNTIIEEAKNPYFNMKIKGFGFFGEGPAIGCVNSVGMFINLLFDKNKNKEALLNVIINSCYLCAKSVMDKETKITNQSNSAIQICDRATKVSVGHEVSSEKIINKEDVDHIFGLTKPEWEAYAKKVTYPQGWKTRLSHHDTGTQVMAFDSSTESGLSLQTFYNDDKSPPDVLIIGIYYPLGTLPTFDDKFKEELARKARENLGSDYSISANLVKMEKLEGVEFIIGRIAQ